MMLGVAVTETDHSAQVTDAASGRKEWKDQAYFSSFPLPVLAIMEEASYWDDGAKRWQWSVLLSHHVEDSCL